MPIKNTAMTIALLGAMAALADSARAEIDLSKLPPPSTRKDVTYEKDIRPLFEASCTRCHGQDKPKGGLQLTSLEGVTKGSKEGKVIIPGKSKESPLVVAISQLDEEKAMPPKFKPGRGGPGGHGGPGGPGGPPGGAGAGAGPGQGDQRAAGAGGGNGGGPGGPGGPGGGPRGGFGPPPKPLTPEQVGLVRAWIDQGAK